MLTGTCCERHYFRDRAVWHHGILWQVNNHAIPDAENEAFGSLDHTPNRCPLHMPARRRALDVNAGRVKAEVNKLRIFAP